jgi:thymidylate synthase
MMMNNVFSVLEHSNLSDAWADLFLKIIENPGKETSTTVVSLKGLKDGICENPTIRTALDDCLMTFDEQQVQTVSNTIFPDNLWKLSQGNRHVLFEKYLASLPRIKALKPSKNCRGLYFERLISFESNSTFNNQLEYIISQYNQNPRFRRSALQASIFDPRRDHTPSAQLGFPCLQHLQFIPDNQEKLLSVNAFYATQQVFQKAYGNYLGICRLGQFMAHEMHLSLDRVNFFIGVAKVEKIRKTDEKIVCLQEKIRKALNSPATTI